MRNNVPTRAKIEFTYLMAKHSTATLSDIQRLMRYGATLGRIAETACNRELTVAEIRKDENVQMDTIAILAPIDCKAVFQGDPRGYTLKIAVPDGYTNDWGREGITVPTS